MRKKIDITNRIKIVMSVFLIGENIRLSMAGDSFLMGKSKDYQWLDTAS